MDEQTWKRNVSLVATNTPKIQILVSHHLLKEPKALGGMADSRVEAGNNTNELVLQPEVRKYLKTHARAACAHTHTHHTHTLMSKEQQNWKNTKQENLNSKLSEILLYFNLIDKISMNSTDKCLNGFINRKKLCGEYSR